MTNQANDANNATKNGDLDGFCCRAKIRPPIEGRLSLAAAAAIRRGGGPAGRRRPAAFAADGAAASPGTAGFVSTLFGFRAFLPSPAPRPPAKEGFFLAPHAPARANP